MGNSLSQLGKNLGRLWLAYTELQNDFYMLQLMFVDFGHFTQPELSLRWSDLCGLSLMPVVIRKDHRQMLIESALHSWHYLASAT